MKPLLPCALALALILPGLARADEFTEFRIPDHRWTAGTARLDGSGRRDANDAYGDANRSHGWNGSLQGSLQRGWDSDRLRHEFGIVALASENATDAIQRTYGPPLTGQLDDLDRQASELWILNGSIRAYPWAVPVGLDLSALAFGQYQQAWFRRDESARIDVIPPIRTEQRVTTRTHRYSYGVQADLAVGVGRVRDASVVYDVHVLEQRLLETGAIAAPLSPATRERLAALDVVAPFYSYAHDRPDRFVWRDIERILREAGALTERGLDPYSVLRAREGYAFSAASRQVGWFAGPVLQARSTHAVSRYDQTFGLRAYQADTLVASIDGSSGYRVVGSSDEFDLGGQAEVHRPLGWSWQLDGFGRVTAPVRPGERGLFADLEASATWLVADRWSASAKVQELRAYFSPRHSGGALSEDDWRVVYGVTLGYYLEDRTQLTASVVETQIQDRVFAVYQRHGEARLGISYRFLGSLDAPGLIDPVRPIR